jgi:trk system potassium uptake protein TrkH
MTVSIAMLLFLGGHFSVKWRMTFESFYNEVGTIPVRSVLKRILLYTFTIESITALLLFSRLRSFYPWNEALWHSVFQSVSAFCNAGFSTWSDSLIRWNSDPFILITISIAIISGGLGFFVLTEIIKTRRINIRRFFKQYSLHTRIVITTSLILIAAGTMLFYAFEHDSILREMTIASKITNSFFQSVTCRTAGFNSVDIAALKNNTLLSMIILMFIGGAPGSIAGGIKVTTIAAVAGLIMARIKGREQIVFWGRALDKDTVDRSLTMIILSALFIIISSFMLMSFSSFDARGDFLEVFFETTSAINTVGLSTGITNRLNDSGKIVITIIMFIGRLGPFALITALTINRKSSPVDYAQEHIMIG